MSELWQQYRNTRYEISNTGKVRRNEYLLKPQLVGPFRNYMQVRLFDGSKKQGRLEYVHRMVVEAFIGPIPENMTINHIDENPSNNNVANLEVVSAFENVKKHIIKHSNGSRIKLSIDDVKYIRQNKDIPAKILAEQYNCNMHTIYRARSGVRWGWVV